MNTKSTMSNIVAHQAGNIYNLITVDVENVNEGIYFAVGRFIPMPVSGKTLNVSCQWPTLDKY